MIISRTPFRISFLGGGTDYPRWYLRRGGQVLATTINKYCYITCRYKPPLVAHRIRLAYNRIEDCQSIDEIEPPVIRGVLRVLELDEALEIHHDADLPGRSGIGSSSSFTVGLLQALHALKGEMVSKRQLAEEAIHVEREILRETVGSQDQTLAAHGGLQHIAFFPDGRIVVRPLTIPHDRREELNGHVMLFYTRIKRTASEVAASYVESLETKAPVLERLHAMVDEGIEILNGDDDITRFGELLDESWQSKRSLSHLTSNTRVDEIYEAARSAGALGGKLTGAGGGGFMLLFAPPHRHEAIRESLRGLPYVPVTFESSGSQVIFYDPDPAASREDRAARRHELEAPRELTAMHESERTKI